jgi:hypothetical protein
MASLRAKLIALRNEEVKPTFGNGGAGGGLLDDDMIDEFVTKQPQTRADWFRRIPSAMRSRVDSKQVSKYLDRVLAIVAASGSNIN